MKFLDKTPLAAAIAMTLSAPLICAETTIAKTSDTKTTTEVTDKPQTFNLNRVTVAATLTEQRVGEVASSVSVIDSESLERQGARDIRDAVRYQPGVEVGSSNRFGLKGFNIRGKDENDVKLVIDGVDQAKSFLPGGDFQRAGRSSFDIDAMKQIDIVKGPASSLYGSSAIGGVVAFTTKDPADFLNTSGDDSAVTFKAAHTSVDQGNHASISLANRHGKLESLLVYSRRDFHERDNQGNTGGEGGEGGEGDSRTERNPADNHSQNILAKLQYQLNDQHRIGLTLEDFRSETDSQLLSENEFNDYSTYFGPGSFIAYTGKRADDSNQRRRISVEHQWQAGLAAFDKMSWSLGQQDSQNNHKTYDNVSASTNVAMMFRLNEGARLKDYQHDEDSLQLNAQFDKSLANHRITYGLNIERVEISNQTNTHYLQASADSEIGRYVPRVEGENYGLFIQDQISLLDDKLQLIPSIRYDRYRAEPSTDSRFEIELADHDSGKFSLGLGAVYQFSDSLSGFAQYGQGFKAPELYHLYYQRDGGSYLNLANPDLKPEENNAFEIGLRSQSTLGNLEVAAFYNDYDNYIEQRQLHSNAPYTGGVSQFVNIAEARIKGLEARAEIWLDQLAGAPLGSSLQFALAYAEGEGKTDGASSQAIDSIAPLTANISLNYDAPDDRWGSALQLTLVDNKDRSDIAERDDGETQVANHGYGVIDLTGYYNINESLRLQAGLYNLTDKKYSQWDDLRGKTVEDDLAYIDRYSQPGRNASVSINYIF